MFTLQLSDDPLSIIFGVIEALPDASNCTVIFFVIAVGCSESSTITSNVLEEVPSVLVAVAVTVVVPTPKVVPGWMSYVITEAGIAVVSVAA